MAFEILTYMLILIALTFLFAFWTGWGWGYKSAWKEAREFYENHTQEMKLNSIPKEEKKCNHIIGCFLWYYDEGDTLIYESDPEYKKNQIDEHFKYCPLCGEKLEDA